MGASSSPDLAFPKGERRTQKKRKVRKDEGSHERKVYAAVDKRDKLRCVITGRKANPYSLDPLDKLHHHHILQRGRDLGPTETWNVASIHSSAHDLIHQNILTVEGSADIALRIGLKSTAVQELFGFRRVPSHIQVIAEIDWPAWLDDHACRMTRDWVTKVEKAATRDE